MYVETVAPLFPETADEPKELFDALASLAFGTRDGLGGGGSSEPLEPKTDFIL